jgi:C-terminal processing protease CtpA/Prc
MTLKTFSDKQLKNFFKESFQQLRQDGTKQLVIDLRDNLGGDSENAEELLSYLTEAPSSLIPRMSVRASAAFKKQVKRRIPWLFRWLPLQNLDTLGQKIWQAKEGALVSLADVESPPAKPEPLLFRGKIALLINGHTLSAASLLANWIKVHKLAKVFGQESGYSSAGLFFEPLQFNLPNSGLSFMVASMALSDEEGQIYTCLEGVSPDQMVQPLIADEMAGTDSILEQTLKYFASEKEERNLGSGLNSSFNCPDFSFLISGSRQGQNLKGRMGTVPPSGTSLDFVTLQ